MRAINNKWSSNRLRNFQIGVLVSLSLVFMAFEWTSTPPDYTESYAIEDAPDETPIIRTKHVEIKKKVPPPEHVAPIIDLTEVVDVEYTEDPIPEKVEDVALVDDKIMEVPPTPATPAPPEAAPIVEPVMVEDVSNEPFIRVERMPIFGSCPDAKTEKERQQCSEKTMLKYVYGNVKYPALARENGIQGPVTVQFIIEKDGSLSNIKIVRDIGGGCGREVKRLIESMPDWIPGQQGIHKVRVKYSLPVIFKLN